MTTLKDDDLEAEARALLRERVERSPWFMHEATHVERMVRIEKEVAIFWHLMIPEAARRLVDRAIGIPSTAKGPAPPRAGPLQPHESSNMGP